MTGTTHPEGSPPLAITAINISINLPIYPKRMEVYRSCMCQTRSDGERRFDRVPW